LLKYQQISNELLFMFTLYSRRRCARRAYTAAYKYKRFLARYSDSTSNSRILRASCIRRHL